MKAIVLTGIRKLEVTELPQPTVRNADEVLIKIKSVGVCGSDIHYYTEGRIGSQVVKFPFRLGHECSGTVVEVGRQVTKVKPGDLVAVDPSVHCGKCDQCLTGRPHTCRNNRFLGCPDQLDGCLAEYLIMPEFCCFPVGQKFDPTTASLIEPLTIGLYSVELSKIDFEGKTVGIFGAGPIGLSVQMVLKTLNAGKIFCFEPLEYRRQKAMKLGAWFASDPLTDEAEASVLAHEPLLLDVVFECSGTQKAVDDSVKVVKPGGKLVLVGIPPAGRYVFDMDLMRRKEISVQNVRRQNHCVGKAIDLVESGLPVGEMVTHHFKPEETQVAFDLLSQYRDGVIKAIIDF